MKKSKIVLTAVLCAAALTGLGAAASGRATVADDPYAPLKLYDGKWDVVMASAGKEVTHLENHCAKTGLFFACEQVVNGKTGALVVFLPFAKLPSGGEEYRTQALRADASAAGEWSKMTIEGERWVYLWEELDGAKKIYWRNINTFSGSDKIHFEIQRSENNSAWKTQNSGDEQRAR